MKRWILALCLAACACGGPEAGPEYRIEGDLLVCPNADEHGQIENTPYCRWDCVYYDGEMRSVAIQAHFETVTPIITMAVGRCLN